jgi:hypothetical protein
MPEWVKILWALALENYIVHSAALLAAVVYLCRHPLRKFCIFLKGVWGRVTGFKFGPVAIEMKQQTDPESGCPYHTPHPASTAAINRNTEAIGGLVKTIQAQTDTVGKMQKDIEELQDRGLKKSFWMMTQPVAERLKDGLEYVNCHKMNGPTKEAVIAAAKRYPHTYDGIVAGRDDLKLPEIN